MIFLFVKEISKEEYDLYITYNAHALWEIEKEDGLYLSNTTDRTYILENYKDRTNTGFLYKSTNFIEDEYAFFIPRIISIDPTSILKFIVEDRRTLLRDEDE